MSKHTILIPLLAVVSLATGCATRVGYRTYGPCPGYYGDQWGPGEADYYNRWTFETRRPPREYRLLRREDQREYWRWRHHHRDYR